MPTIPQSIINLYDAFTHGRMSRRDFMQQLTLKAGGAAAAALLGQLSNNYAEAAVIAEDDARLVIGAATFPGPDGNVKAYTAAPSSSSTKTAASTPTSRTSRAASRWKVSPPSRPTCSAAWAALQPTRTRRAT